MQTGKWDFFRITAIMTQSSQHQPIANVSLTRDRVHHLNHLSIVAPKSYHKLGMSCKKLFNMHFQLPTHISVIKQTDENQPLYNASTKHYASQ